MERLDLAALRAACLRISHDYADTGGMAGCLEAANSLEEWRPNGYAEAPYGAGSESMREAMALMRKGQQPQDQDAAAMAKNFAEWREKTTSVEARNCGTLLGLLALHRDACDLAARFPDDRSIVVCRDGFERVLRGPWRVEAALPMPRLEAREYVTPHCKARVMPNEWRGL